jgi:hypothetical protein
MEAFMGHLPKTQTQLYSEMTNNLSNPDRINLNVLIENTSLNSPERTGVYYVTGNNIGALPSGFSNYGILLCMRSPYSLHPTNSNCVYVQEYTDVYGKHASRSFNNGAWTNWVTTATKDDLSNLSVTASNLKDGSYGRTLCFDGDNTNKSVSNDSYYIAIKSNGTLSLGFQKRNSTEIIWYDK